VLGLGGAGAGSILGSRVSLYVCWVGAGGTGQLTVRTAAWVGAHTSASYELDAAKGKLGTTDETRLHVKLGGNIEALKGPAGCGSTRVETIVAGTADAAL
jgi:hypothetical protein